MNHFKTLLRICLAVVLLGLLPQHLQATHIVGGDMEYDILEKTDTTVTIQIKLSVYRDCFFGDPAVFFDNPAFIGIFNRANVLVDSLSLAYTGTDDTLNQGLDSFCLVNLQPVCVHTTFYEGTITLPIVEGGYTFAYQRCCRNETIANIIEPLETGATFLIEVNDAAIARANNSPEYDDWPPIYICAGEPLVFSHSATDVDGDSLVYSLCLPFKGGTRNNPQPIPSNPPPYDTVALANGYTLENLLGSGEPLQIDPETGLMTARPMILGQFVIGVCVSEYDRNTGELLSVLRRDFQYNVNPCENIAANFEAPDVICDALDVVLQNVSTSPPVFEWYANGTLFSTADTNFLNQTFPDTGSYQVQLVAVPNTICADTFSRTISFVSNSIEPDFFQASLNCVDSTILVLSDQSLDTISTIDSYRWSVQFNGISIDLEGRNPILTLPSGISGTITLTVTNTNGCEEIFTRPFDSSIDNPTDFILSSQSVCAGESVALNPLAPDSLAFNYQWAPANLLDDANAQNPIATVTETTTFSVTITNANEGCEAILETTITVLGTPTADFGAQQECGSLAYTFTNESTNADRYFWDFGVTNEVADTAITRNAVYTYPEAGTYTVTMIAINDSGCADTISRVIEVENNEIQLVVDQDLTTCASEVTITPSATSSVIFTYVDEIGNEIGSGTSFTLDVSGTRTITVVATDINGCKELQMITINGGPVDVTAPDTVLACGLDEVNFGLVNNDPNDTLSYVWSPDSIFDPSTINNAEPTFTGAFGDYDVSVIVTNQFSCADTFNIALIVLDDNGTLDFEWEPDCGGSNIQFTSTGSMNFGHLWDFGGLGTSTELNPDFTFPGPGQYLVTLSTQYGDSCIAATSQTIVVTDVVLQASATVGSFNCTENGVSIDLLSDILNETNDTLIYNWTFSNGNPASSNEVNPTVFVDQSGDLMISLTVISEDSCTSSYDTTINVQLPQVNVADEVTICPGDSTELNPGFDPTLTYTWTPATSFDANTPNPVVSEAGTYTVMVSTTAGDISCPAFDTITVVIADSIELTLSGPDGNVIPETVNNEVNQDGSDMLPEIFTCGEEVPVMANVEAGINVVWTDYNGNVLSNDNPAGFNPILRDTVIATASDQFGCMVADTVVIVNQQVDVVADPASAEVTVCATQDTFLGVVNQDPNDTLTFVWEANDIIISPLDSAYVVVMPTAEGEVELNVTVTNQFGCDTMLVFTVTVDPFTSTTFPDTVNACFEQQTALNPGGVAIDGYTYEWSPMNGDFSNPANPVVNLNADQLYHVTITDPATGCSETDSIQVIVAPDLMFEAASTQDTSLCFPGDVTFMTTHGPDVVVSWYDGFPFTPPALATADDYTISLTQDGEMITVYAEALDTITGCRDTLTFNADLQEFEPGTFPDTTNACFGEDTPINPNGTTNPNYTYTWEPNIGNDANPTVNLMEDMIFFVTVTDPQTTCFFTDSVFVSVSEEINFTATPMDTILCEPGTFTVFSTNDANASVVWYADPELTMEIGNGPTIDITVEAEGTVTIYGVATEPEFGCTEQLTVTASYDIIDDGLPALNPQGCFNGDPVVLFPGGVNTNYVYTYSPADCVDTSDPDNPVYNCDESSEVTVTIQNPATGCSIDVPVQVDIINITNLTGSATPDTIVLENSTTLEVFGCEGDCNYNWMEPNGTLDPNGSTATATPDEAGDLVYLVEVTNSVCTEVVEIPVFVIDVMCIPDRVYLPNAFSPNNDGANDRLRVRSTFINQIEEFELMIFNRWGQQMYRSFDPLGSWDGTFEGDDLEPDVYGYYLRVVCPDGEVLIQKGNITLLR